MRLCMDRGVEIRWWMGGRELMGTKGRVVMARPGACGISGIR